MLLGKSTGSRTTLAMRNVEPATMGSAEAELSRTPSCHLREFVAVPTDKAAGRCQRGGKRERPCPGSIVPWLYLLLLQSTGIPHGRSGGHSTRPFQGIPRYYKHPSSVPKAPIPHAFKQNFPPQATCFICRHHLDLHPEPHKPREASGATAGIYLPGAPINTSPGRLLPAALLAHITTRHSLLHFRSACLCNYPAQRRERGSSCPRDGCFTTRGRRTMPGGGWELGELVPTSQIRVTALREGHCPCCGTFNLQISVL